MKPLHVVYFPPKRRAKPDDRGRFILKEDGQTLGMAEITPGYGVEPWLVWAVLGAMVDDFNGLLAANPNREKTITDTAEAIRESFPSFVSGEAKAS